MEIGNQLEAITGAQKMMSVARGGGSGDRKRQIWEMFLRVKVDLNSLWRSHENGGKEEP